MINYLCPVCKKELILTEASYKCGNNHCFDRASEGYVNLAVGKADSGDSKEMCRARHEFLSAGYYEPFADALARQIGSFSIKRICDAGCGEGYYSRRIKNLLPDADIVGLDLAKTSVKIGARAEKGKEAPISYAVAGIFDMPLPDGSLDGVISVFAPVPEDEAFRILSRNGRLFVCHPGKDHLNGLKALLYENPYDNAEKELSFRGFVLEDEITVKYSVTVKKEHIQSLFLMTPYYWKTSKRDSDKLNRVDHLLTDLDFIISIYKKI